jgi:curved DNA-binding protein CbpA
MNSVVDTIVAAPANNEAQLPSRILEIRTEESKLVCVGADGREFRLSRLVGSNVRVGDELLAPGPAGTATADAEVYIRKPSTRRADVYQVRAGYAALPKLDRREETFVRVQVAEGQLGISAIHLPCPVIRDYFFAANRRTSWPSQPTFYYLLGLPQDVTQKELRLAYRLRRMELQKQNASKAELATIERAYNMLADPDIRGVYDALIKDSATPVPFPYSGFGSLLVQGEQSAESGVFFGNRILGFMPERRHRTIPVPLRNLDYFEDCAILRDHHRKLEVLIDNQLLPLRWDPTWRQWRHLITATVKISADFIHTGRYRKRGGDWKLIEWETALPSRTELEVPEGLEEDIIKARRTHTRFGQYWRQIDRLRAHVQEIPTERGELSRLCWNLGLPGDFDVAQITWRPDYDSYYHDQLTKRSRAMYVFRDEYIFDLEKSVIVEVPQAGHATYVFTKPDNVKHWVWQYAMTTRQDIRLNRGNIAASLGFLGRVVHGKKKAEWLKELRVRIGEPPDYAQQTQ